MFADLTWMVGPNPIIKCHISKKNLGIVAKKKKNLIVERELIFKQDTTSKPTLLDNVADIVGPLVTCLHCSTCVPC